MSRLQDGDYERDNHQVWTNRPGNLEALRNRDLVIGKDEPNNERRNERNRADLCDELTWFMICKLTVNRFLEFRFSAIQVVDIVNMFIRQAIPKHIPVYKVKDSFLR